MWLPMKVGYAYSPILLMSYDLTITSAKPLNMDAEYVELSKFRRMFCDTLDTNVFRLMFCDILDTTVISSNVL